jgi:hypothetical protein
MPAETTGILVALKSYGIYITGALAAAVGYGDLRRKVTQNTQDIGELRDTDKITDKKFDKWKEASQAELNKIHDEIASVREAVNQTPMEVIKTLKELDLLNK